MAPVFHGPSKDQVQTVHMLGCTSGRSVEINRPSALGLRTVRPVSMNCPPQARGPSAWHCAGLLSPLLLESFFRFGVIWGLFLGLVGPL
jgi:hypothetical protein